jgi:beta-N-acetylhexosaminidase
MYPRMPLLVILAALPLWIAVPGKLQAAAPGSLQEALGAPPPAELAPPPAQDPFKETPRRSAPFIDLREKPMPPLGKWGVPPGFKPLPMVGPQGPQSPRTPHSSAPEVPRASPLSPVLPKSSLRNSTADRPLQTPSAASANGVNRDDRAAQNKPALSDMIGQMIMVGVSGVELQEKDPLLSSIRAGRAGGVILSGRGGVQAGPKDIESPAPLRLLTTRLQQAAPHPLLIAVNQEGGRVQRLTPEQGFTGGPAAAALGKGSPETTRRAARRMGLEMAAVGINFDFAPVADLNINPSSPGIGAMQRSFGADPNLAAAHVIAFGEGLIQAGVAPCLKYFPGRGSAREDSHDALPDISATWQPAELIPFQKAIQEGWSGAVMPGHLYHRGLDALRPASLSLPVLNGLLRGKMGFAGVIVSDDMQGDAVVKAFSLEDRILFAVEAGVDILLFSNSSRKPDVSADEVHAALLRLTQEGRINPARIEQSFERISRLKQRFAGWKP